MSSRLSENFLFFMKIFLKFIGKIKILCTFAVPKDKGYNH